MAMVMPQAPGERESRLETQLGRAQLHLNMARTKWNKMHAIAQDAEVCMRLATHSTLSACHLLAQF